MALRTMFDSTAAGDIPGNAGMVAAYVDGTYKNVDEVRSRFPKATLVTITVTGEAGANVIDRETGDVSAATAATWAKNEIAAKRRPTIYMNASSWPEVKTAVVKETGLFAGVFKRRKVCYWVAEYDGDPSIPKGAVAKQYLGSPGNSPGHYDVSVAVSDWPVKPPKPPKPRSLPVRVRFAVWIAHGWLTRYAKIGKRPLYPVSVAKLDQLKDAVDAAEKV